MTSAMERLQKSHAKKKRRVEDRAGELVEVNKRLKKEIVQHERARKELGLLLAMTQRIHEAQSFHSALEIALEKVCKATGWSFGEAWVPRSDGTTLECSPAWYGEGHKLRTFRNLSVGMTFSRGVGLPGRVWQSKQPDWILIPSMMAEKIFQRKQIATECGLKAALGVPIIVDDGVLAVLVFFMPESLEKSRRMIDLVFAVAIQLGSVFKQKRAEEELRKGRRELENRVQERTAELARANQELRAEIEERRRAMETIRESEERFRAMADQAPVMIWMSGPDKLCNYFNKRWLGFSGRTMEQELGTGWTDGVHRDDLQQCLEIYFNAFDDRRDFKMEYRLRRFDGEYRCILDHGTPRFLSDGSFQGYIGSCIDITERKQVEDALEESRRTLTTLMGNLPGMVYRCRNDRNWTMEFVSEGCLDLTGYHHSDLLQGRKVSFGQLIHPDDRESVWEEVQKAVGNKRAFKLVYRISTAGGEQKWVWEQGRGVYTGGGQLQALEGFATDITDRVRTREALREERDFAESLIETAQVIILVLDNEGRIVRFNPYMERLSGYRLEEVQGGEWFSTFLPEGERDRIRKLFSEVMNEAETHGLNAIVCKDGHERLIEWCNTTLKDPEGRVVGVLALGQDITEKTRLQEQLVESERLAAIGATTAKLAHEIGNPLNGMYLSVQLLQQQLSRHDDIRDDKVVSTATKLENEIVRLNRLLTEFRSLSRAEKYHFQPVSLVKILSDVLAIEKPRYTELAIHVEVDVPDDLPVIVADGDRLKQAFLNLCKNASEAMPEGGSLVVKARRSGDGVVVEITDTGGGIPEGMDITQPFATTKLQGSGIGLVVVRQIIAAHGGSIEYTSESGKGTVCHVSLPLYPIT